jgi:hypothetical protein
MKHVGIGIVPPLELVTCSHVFSPQLPLNQTCKLSSSSNTILYDKAYRAFAFPLGLRYMPSSADQATVCLQSLHTNVYNTSRNRWYCHEL